MSAESHLSEKQNIVKGLDKHITWTSSNLGSKHSFAFYEELR